MHAHFGTQLTYKGVELKSKHERAWAREWDRRALKWAYEPTKFTHGRESYTPDFLITLIYIEIKAMGARNLNKFHLCTAPLLIIFGTPDQHYVQFKPAGAAQCAPGHFRNWTLAYQKALA